jgi:hypothetical protein
LPLTTPQRTAQGVNKLIIYASSAQCFPRLACALQISLLMQLHDYNQTSPALEGERGRTQKLRMQIHADRMRISIILST